MPYRVEWPCRAHLCPNTTSNSNGYCDEHQDQAREQRGSAYSRGYDKRWIKFRNTYLREHPLCMDCQAEGKLTPATEVHHIQRLAEHPELKFVKSNLLGLCHACHSKRTARGE